ncbi:MAG: DUF2339 domain-containing protein [Planctomycetota bacterium]
MWIEIALAVGLVGVAIGLLGLALAGLALTRIEGLKRALRRTRYLERKDRTALRDELLGLLKKAEQSPNDALAVERDVEQHAPPAEPSDKQPDPVLAATPAPVSAVEPQPQHRNDRPLAPVHRAGPKRRDEPRRTSSAPPSRPHASNNSRGFEQFLGTKMLVWLGGLALALAMGFFVHHAFSNSWVTPELRLFGGAGFSLILLIAAEVVRTKVNAVAQAMSGAGIAGLYAVIYSANHFYGFIGSPLDFLLSVAVTAAAVTLALRHGPFTAVLGLLGGFVMPVLLRTGDPVGGTFFGYLILLQLALVAVGRRRDWRWLSALSLVFGTLWGGMSVLDLFPITARVWPEALFLGMAAVYVFADWPTTRAGKQSSRVWLGFVGVCVSLLLMLAHVSSGAYEPRGLGLLGLLAAATLVLARLDGRFVRLPWAALAAVAGMLMAYSAWGQRRSVQAEGFVAGFSVAAGAYAAVLVLGAWACTWRSRRTTEWAWFSLASGVVISGLVLIALWDDAEADFAWWALSAGMSGVYAVMASPRYRALKRGESTSLATAGDDRAVGVWAGGSALFAGASVALAGYDDLPWMRLGWAALALVTWGGGLSGGISTLRGVVATLGILVGLCAIWPGPNIGPIASTPVWNGLLLAYGGSVVLLGVVAWGACRREDIELSEVLQGITLGILFLMPAVLIRHGFEGEDWYWDTDYTLYEAATHAVAWLTLAIVAALLGSAWRQRIISIGGLLYAMVGTLVAVVGSGLVLNPLWNAESVGTGLVINGLLYLYGLPAAMVMGLSWLLRRTKTISVQAVGPISAVLGVACLLLIFIWVSLNVRQGFVGSTLHLDLTEVSNAEWYAYSVAWVALGAILLLIGVVTGSATARWGSLALMMVAVVKVFIFDAAELRDLYRVLSFLGLGISLMALGAVYQKFVFKTPRPPAADDSPQAIA